MINDLLKQLEEMSSLAKNLTSDDKPNSNKWIDAIANINMEYGIEIILKFDLELDERNQTQIIFKSSDILVDETTEKNMKKLLRLLFPEQNQSVINDYAERITKTDDALYKV